MKLYCKYLVMIAVFCCIALMGYSQPHFISDSPQTLSACQNTGGISITGMLGVNDTSTGNIITWDVVTNPVHGTLVNFPYSSSSNGAFVLPVGLQYVSAIGYSGNDSFSIVVGNGVFSDTMKILVVVHTLPTASFVTVPVGSCTNYPITYTTQIGQSNYTWSVPGTFGVDYSIVSGGLGLFSNTVVLKWLTPGSKSVNVAYASSDGCQSNTAVSTIAVSASPAPSFYVSIPANICVNTEFTYVTQVAETNYIWTVPGVSGTDYLITSGGIGDSSNSVTIEWLTPGRKSVGVNYTNSAGCTSTSAAVSATTSNSLPTPLFSTSPGINSCINADVVYATQPGQNSYLWAIPGVAGLDYSISAGGVGLTNNSVTLKWLTTGTKEITISYTSNFGCLSSSVAINSTTVNNRPIVTFSNQASSNTCANVPVEYTTEPGHSNYNWTISGSASGYHIDFGSTASTSNSVTLEWLNTGNESVSVNYTTAQGCAAETPTSSTTFVHPFPNVIFTSHIPASICKNATVVYSTRSGQNNYLWTLPTSGYSIVDGGIGTDDSTVTLSWQTSGNKTVTVNYSDPIYNCTAQSPTANTIRVDTLPVASFVSPPTVACIGRNITYTTQGGSGQHSYLWSPQGTSITDYVITAGGGAANNTMTLYWVNSLVATPSVSVTYSDLNNCVPESPASVTTIVSNSASAATFQFPPPLSICANTVVRYATEASQYGYSWSIPGSPLFDYDLISGGTTSTDSVLTVRWLTPGVKNVTVSYTTPGGCVASPAQSVITVHPLPPVSFSTAPLPTTCKQSTITYTTQSGQTNYLWSIPGTRDLDYSIVGGGMSASDSTVTLQWSTIGTKTVGISYNDIYGCSSSSTNSTLVHSLPVVTFTSTVNASICKDDHVVYTTQPAQTNYIWNLSSYVIDVDYSIVGGGADAASNSVTVEWRTPGSKTISVNYTNDSGCTALTSAPSTISVNDLPNVSFIDAPTVVCQEATVTYMTQPGQYNYLWDFPGVSITDTTRVAGGTAADNYIRLKWNNPVSGNKVVKINYSDNNGCKALQAADTSAIVFALPLITSPLSKAICSGTGVNDTLLADSFSTFSWTYNYSSLALLSGANNGSGSIIADEGLINSSSSESDTMWYSVTPRSGNVASCVGHTRTLTVLVHPIPKDTTDASYTICSGSDPDITFKSTIPLSNYTWKVISTVNVPGIDSSRSGYAINYNIINSSHSAQGNVFYRVFPISPEGCGGDSGTIVVYVNPIPFNTTDSFINICSGDTLHLSLTDSVLCRYTWSVFPSNGIIGGKPGTSTTDIDQSLLNQSDSTIGTIVYQVIDTSQSGGCGGQEKDVTVKIYPKPTVRNASSQKTCSGTQINIGLSASLVSNYTWGALSNSQGIFGASTIKTTSNIDDILTNASDSVAGVVVYTVIPSSTLAKSCVGPVSTITVNVNPIPRLNDTSFTICSNGLFDFKPSCTVDGTEQGCIYQSFDRPFNNGISIIPGGDISEIFDTISSNSILTKDSIYYNFIFSSKISNCPNNELIKIVINPTPPAPAINSFDQIFRNITPCSGSSSVNFGANTPPAQGVQYSWSSPGDIVISTGNNQYSIISFSSVGDHNVSISAKVDGFSCPSYSNVLTKKIDSSISSDPPLIYFSLDEFICLDSWVKFNCDTINSTCWSYLWGWDDAASLAPNPQYSEINQIWVVKNLDTMNNKYWVVTIDSNTGCPQKSYYGNGKWARYANSISDSTPISVIIYPNPARNNINIEMKGSDTTDIVFEIFDISGRRAGGFPNKSLLNQISVSEFSPGYYIVIYKQHGVIIGRGGFVKV